MMSRAARLAVVLRHLHGIEGTATEYDVDAAICEAGLRVKEYPFVSELTALIYGRTIYLKPGMDRPTRTMQKVHELGHWELAHGNMFFTTLTAQQMAIYGNRDERDAMIFAGCFLYGYPLGPRFDERVREAVDEGMPVLEFFNALASAR
jgi:hypothetical protein